MANLKRSDAGFRPGFGEHVKEKYVCFDCRKVCKAGGWYNKLGTKHCPHCGKLMINCGKAWRFPRRNDLRGWKRERERFRSRIAVQAEAQAITEARPVTANHSVMRAAPTFSREGKRLYKRWRSHQSIDVFEEV